MFIHKRKEAEREVEELSVKQIPLIEEDRYLRRGCGEEDSLVILGQQTPLVS